jgi:hypothetical protein
MLYRDPPDHTRLRAAVSRTFTPRAMDAWRPRIQQLVEELLDRVQGAGAMDVIADLAAPLPVAVIGELLGVPVDDRAGIMGLSADVARSLDALPVPADRELVERGRAARRMLGTYFRHLAAARRCKPQDDRLQTPAGFRCGFRRNRFILLQRRRRLSPPCAARRRGGAAQCRSRPVTLTAGQGLSTWRGRRRAVAMRLQPFGESVNSDFSIRPCPDSRAPRF